MEDPTFNLVLHNVYLLAHKDILLIHKVLNAINVHLHV